MIRKVVLSFCGIALLAFGFTGCSQSPSGDATPKVNETGGKQVPGKLEPGGPKIKGKSAAPGNSSV